MPSSVFLSHSSNDNAFVEKLYEDLTREDIDVWFDKWEIKVGDSIIRKIEEGLKNNDYLIIVLSENSVKSEWVRRELSVGLMKEIEEKSVVVLPILLEDCEIPMLLKEKRYADFRGLYQKGYNELIDSIRAHEGRREIKKELDDLEPVEQINFIKKMRDELKQLKRERIMLELEAMALPLEVLIKKVGEEEARTYTNYFQDSRTVEELPLELQEVIIKTVSAEEYNTKYMLHPAWKALRRDTKMVWKETPDLISNRVGKEVGTVIIGAYKKLLDIHSELFEEELFKFKEDYDLSDVEWDEIKGEIRSMMERGYLPQIISNYVLDYIFSQTEEGKVRLKKILTSNGYNPLTEEEIDHYHKLAQEKREG